MTDVIEETRADDIAQNLQNLPDEDLPDNESAVDDMPGEDTVPGESPGDETAGPTINPALLQQAGQYGLSESDLQGLDDARVGSMFAAIDRGRMQPARAAAMSSRPSDSQAGTAGERQEYTPLKVEFGDDLDPSVVKPVQSFVDHYNGAMQEFHGFRQQIAQELHAINLLRECGEFDDFVRGLGEEWVPTYGSGRTIDMDPRSAEFKMRLSVLQGAKGLVGDAGRRNQRLSVPESHLRSHRGTHWDRIVKEEREKTGKKVATRRAGSGERPTKAKPTAGSVHQRAVDAFRR